jgi:BCD family chlorophyll transporter-like MFS transporter
MGLWGAAQAAAFGLGGLLGTAASDLAHALLGEQRTAYAAVFGLQGLMFAVSAAVALRLRQGPAAQPTLLRFDGPVMLKGGSSS